MAVKFPDQVVPSEEVERIPQIAEAVALFEPVKHPLRPTAFLERRLIRQADLEVRCMNLPKIGGR